jgi:hypothetical protein
VEEEKEDEEEEDETYFVLYNCAMLAKIQEQTCRHKS